MTELAPGPVPAHASRRPATQVLGIAVAVLVVWGAAANFKDFIWYNLFPKRFGEVVPGELYRSGKLTPAAFTKVVRENGIRTIVDFGAWPEGSRADRRAARTAAALGVDRIRLPGLEGDSTGEVNGYVEALRIMNDPERRPVLVHCGAGTERTGCVVALYRMFEEGWTLQEAYAEADDKGHSPRRNPHLRETLETWAGPIRDALTSGGRVEAPEGPAQDAGTEGVGAGRGG